MNYRSIRYWMNNKRNITQCCVLSRKTDLQERRHRSGRISSRFHVLPARSIRYTVLSVSIQRWEIIDHWWVLITRQQPLFIRVTDSDITHGRLIGIFSFHRCARSFSYITWQEFSPSGAATGANYRRISSWIFISLLLIFKCYPGEKSKLFPSVKSFYLILLTLTDSHFIQNFHDDIITDHLRRTNLSWIFVDDIEFLLLQMTDQSDQKSIGTSSGWRWFGVFLVFWLFICSDIVEFIHRAIIVERLST